MQILLSTLCLALTSAVIGNAYVQKQQFYPAVVYITKSNASMAVIYLQFFVIVFMFGKLLRKIFLGTLRAAEFEHLLERFWYALTETCLAFTVFRDDFNPRFVALFTVLLFLKSFHWLAEERVDFMERSPVLGWLFHIRVASLLMVLGVLDYLLLSHAYEATVLRGPTVQLVFGFEYAILLTVVLSTLIKYVLHTAEMRTDTPWENKAVFLLYTELVIGLIKVVLYVLFVFIMAKIYALPMFVFRPMFFTIRNFKRALSDVIMSRRAIRNMNTLYPDATPEELRLSDNICIICREDMVNHSKKLPCGHIFHTTCLRSWFQRQQTCPTCRLNILRTPTANSTALRRPEDGAAAVAAAAAAGAAPAAPQTGAAPTANANNVNADVPRADLMMGPNIFENAAAGQFANLLAAGMPQASMMPPPPPPPFMFPPAFPFAGPYAVPPPPMPPDLTNFTDEELRAMEGNERSHVEQRIKLLRDIQTLLNAAGTLMTNYQIVSAQHFPAPPAGAEATAVAASAAAATTQSQASPATDVSSPTVPSVASASSASPARDGPSTSAGAAAAAFAAFTQAKSAAVPTTITSQPKASSSPAAGDAVAVTERESNGKQTFGRNDVTIEDLGREENEDKVISAAAATTNDDNIPTIDGSDNAELCELRKRRLKFLEERNQSAAEGATTTTNTTAND